MGNSRIGKRKFFISLREQRGEGIREGKFELFNQSIKKYLSIKLYII